MALGGPVSPPAAAVRRPLPVSLFAAILAVVIAVAWLFTYTSKVEAIAGQYVRVLGPQNLPFKAQTLTLQRAALKVDNVLPIYGTSELYCCAGGYNAASFYLNAPTGFSVFSVGYPVTEDLFWAETFGALGNDIRGHKVVVSDSPWFMTAGGITTAAYAHTYEPEIAAVFTFDAPVPLGLRAAVAQRMLDFPTTLKGQPVLEAALLDLSRKTWYGYGAYLLLDPAGRLIAWSDQLNDATQTITTLENLDHPKPSLKNSPVYLVFQHTPWWRTVLQQVKALAPPMLQAAKASLDASGPKLNPVVPIHPQQINWDTLLQKTTALAESSTPTNPFGVAPSQWTHCTDIEPVSGGMCKTALQLYNERRSNHGGTVYPVQTGFVQGEVQCACWDDLNLEFEVLDSVGAEPLAWVQPIQGFLDDYTPYSAATRRVVYDRYMAIAKADGITATTFQTHDDDPMFVNSFGHMSQRGWTYANRLLDLFWHGQLGLVQANLAKGGSVGMLFLPALNCPQPQWCQGVDNVPPLRGELAGLPTGMPSLWGKGA